MQALSVVNRLGRPALSELLAKELARSWLDVARFKDSHGTWTAFMLPAVLHFLKGALDNLDSIPGQPRGVKPQAEVRQLPFHWIYDFRMSSACRNSSANLRMQHFAAQICRSELESLSALGNDAYKTCAPCC